MNSNRNHWTAAVFLATLSLVGAVGCARSADEVAVTPAAGHDHEASEATGHTHGAWWCDEHGVPEKVCALCDSKLAAEFQRKGDWCAEHHRPDSQCFACHPELEARFAAQYEAKYGKEPPKPRG